MPGDGLTHGPPATKKLAAKTTGSAGSSGIPCATVLRLIRDLPGDRLGTGLSCPHRPRAHHLAGLTPASGCQDHTTSPSASALARRARPTRPSHPAANVRDDREAPLMWRQDGAIYTRVLIF